MQQRPAMVKRRGSSGSARRGLTRGESKACAHALCGHAKDMPCGVVDEATGQLSMTCGSAAKTSDFIVDGVAARWDA